MRYLIVLALLLTGCATYQTCDPIIYNPDGSIDIDTNRCPNPIVVPPQPSPEPIIPVWPIPPKKR